MSNVIAFLETLGGNATLAGQSADAYQTAVDALGLDAGARQALLDRDPTALSRLLGGRMEMTGFLFPAEEEQPSEGEEQEGEDDEPAQDPAQESIRRTGRH